MTLFPHFVALLNPQKIEPPQNQRLVADSLLSLPDIIQSILAIISIKSP